MKAKKILFYLLAGLLGGCVPVMSLHPLYTKKKVVFDERLLGSWVDDSDESNWQFNHYDKEEKAYELTFRDNEGKKGSFIVHLAQLGNELFLDVYPSERLWESLEPNETYVYNSIFLLPLHTFIKVESIEPELRIRLTDDEDFGKILKEDPNTIQYESTEAGMVLTASTEELQAFVIEHANDSRLFSKEIVLIRQKAAISREPNDIDPNVTDPNGTHPDTVAPTEG